TTSPASFTAWLRTTVRSSPAPCTKSTAGRICSLRCMPSRTSGALGEIIRQQRELAEISMRQFADLAGISNPYLSQIERGLRAPSEHVLEGIAGALKVSADALYRQAGMAPPGEEPANNAVLDAIETDSR